MTIPRNEVKPDDELSPHDNGFDSYVNPRKSAELIGEWCFDRDGQIQKPLRLAHTVKADTVVVGKFGGGPTAPSRRISRPTNLPEDFWEAHPVLASIRQYANGSARSADAVFYYVLARQSAMLSGTKMQTGVKGPASLNMFVANIAKSGVGKSSASEDIIGEEIMPIPNCLDMVEAIPLGSGEGIAESYMGDIEEPLEEGEKKPRTAHKQVRRNSFMVVDEGSALADLLTRSGSTLGETLRRAWIGATLGQANASPDKKRVVRDYHFGLVINFQDTAAASLLTPRMIGLGTPQRFVFADTIDPNIPDEPFPYKIPDLSIKTKAPFVTFVPPIQKDIRRMVLASSRGETTVDELDTHIPLHLAKISANLAILLDGCHEVDLNHWWLATIVWDTSCAVRSQLLSNLSDIEAQESERRTMEYAGRVAATSVITARATVDAARATATMVNSLRKHGPQSPSDLRKRLLARDRHLFQVALNDGISSREIVEDGKRFALGGENHA